jgi:hypothetical protein
MLLNLLKKILNPAGQAAKLITSFFQIGLAMVKKILGYSSAYPYILNKGLMTRYFNLHR